jgi:hypothetical protein
MTNQTEETGVLWAHHVGLRPVQHRHARVDVDHDRCPEPDTWIIVCEHFHGAVGPIPTEPLAVQLAAYASEIGACAYRPVRLALAQGRAAGRADDETPIRSTGRRR